MPLEAADYIAELVATNPVHATDDVSQGDDHLRLIKDVLKQSFAGIGGAVTSTHTELNLLDGVTTPTGSGALVLATGPTIVSPTIVSPTISTSIILPAASIADAALSSNVPLKDVSNIFTGSNRIQSATPQWLFVDTDATTDQTRTTLFFSDGAFRVRSQTDGGGIGSDLLAGTRSGTTWAELEINATLLDCNGNADISGTLAIGGTTAITAAAGAVLNITDTTAPVTTTLQSGNTTGLVGTSTAHQFSISTDNTVRAFFSGDGSEIQFDAALLDCNGNLDADGTTMDIDGSTSLELHGGSADINLSGTTAQVVATTIDLDGNVVLGANSSSTLRINAQGLTGGALPGAADAFVVVNVNGSSFLLPLFDA